MYTTSYKQSSSDNDLFIVSAAAAAVAGIVMVCHVNLIDYSLLVRHQSFSFINVQQSLGHVS